MPSEFLLSLGLALLVAGLALWIGYGAGRREGFSEGVRWRRRIGGQE